MVRVDVSDMFSPERVTLVCKQYGLISGQAMDIKHVFDFDLAADRKKAWDSILQDKPKLVIGSPPCTFVSRLQELNKHMYRNDAACGWQSFRRASSKPRDMLDLAPRYTNINEKPGVIFYTNTLG